MQYKGTSFHLENVWEHDLAVPRVLVAELALVSLVFLNSPERHLNARYHKENERTDSKSHDTDCKPCNGLVKVVWATDQRKRTTVRDATNAGTSRTQVHQDDMRLKVSKLRSNPQRNAWD